MVIDDAGNKINIIHWYVPLYTGSVPQQGIITKQILEKTPTGFDILKDLFFMKDVNVQNLWNSELGSQ